MYLNPCSVQSSLFPLLRQDFPERWFFPIWLVGAGAGTIPSLCECQALLYSVLPDNSFPGLWWFPHKPVLVSTLLSRQVSLQFPFCAKILSDTLAALVSPDTISCSGTHWAHQVLPGAPGLCLQSSLKAGPFLYVTVQLKSMPGFFRLRWKKGPRIITSKYPPSPSQLSCMGTKAQNRSRVYFSSAGFILDLFQASCGTANWYRASVHPLTLPPFNLNVFLYYYPRWSVKWYTIL